MIIIFIPIFLILFAVVGFAVGFGYGYEQHMLDTMTPKQRKKYLQEKQRFNDSNFI